MSVLARFLRNQVALADRPPPGCVQLNNEEAAVCAEALERCAAPLSEAQLLTDLLDCLEYRNEGTSVQVIAGRGNTFWNVLYWLKRTAAGEPLADHYPDAANVICTCGKRFGEHPIQPPWWPCMVRAPKNPSWPDPTPEHLVKQGFRSGHVTDEKCEHRIPRRFCTALHQSDKKPR